MRNVETAVLVKHDFRVRRLESPVSDLASVCKRSIFDIDESVLKLAVFCDDSLGRGLRVLSLTVGVLRHINRLRSRRRACQINLARDSSFITFRREGFRSRGTTAAAFF